MKLAFGFILVGLFLIPVAFGQEPAPKKTDSTFVTDSGGGLDASTPAGQTISFTVKALYPVILVQGYSSDGVFWSRSEHDFTQPLRARKMLYDDSINFQNRGKAEEAYRHLWYYSETRVVDCDIVSGEEAPKYIYRDPAGGLQGSNDFFVTTKRTEFPTTHKITPQHQTPDEHRNHPMIAATDVVVKVIELS